MKTDLDQLMAERELDVLVIVKEGQDDVMPMRYMTGGVRLGGALLIKRRDHAPALVCGPMERDEAAKSGLELHTFDEFDSMKIFKESKGDRVQGRAKLWDRIFVYVFGFSHLMNLHKETTL